MTLVRSFAMDRAAAARAIRDFLRALDVDLDHPDLAATPERVADAFIDELLAGARVDIPELLLNGSTPLAEDAPRDLAILRDLHVTSTCPHHLMPSFGMATVAYLPGTRLLGLGTVARLVDATAQKLTLQETIAREIVSALTTHAGARGAFVALTLRHTCFTCRGARQPNARLTTTAAAGALADPAAQQQLLALVPGQADR